MSFSKLLFLSTLIASQGVFAQSGTGDKDHKEIETAIANVYKEVSSARQTLGQIRADLAGLEQSQQSALSKLGNSVDKTDSRVQEVSRDISKASAQIGELNRLINIAQASIQSAQDQISRTYTELQATHAEVSITRTGVTAANQTLAQLTEQVGASESKRIGQEIENQLRSGKYNVSLYVPATAGGNLNLVADIVKVNIQMALSAGKNVDEAVESYDKGVKLLSDSHYTGALNHFGRAYRKLLPFFRTLVIN